MANAFRHSNSALKAEIQNYRQWTRAQRIMTAVAPKLAPNSVFVPTKLVAPETVAEFMQRRLELNPNLFERKAAWKHWKNDMKNAALGVGLIAVTWFAAAVIFELSIKDFVESRNQRAYGPKPTMEIAPAPPSPLQQRNWDWDNEPFAANRKGSAPPIAWQERAANPQKSSSLRHEKSAESKKNAMATKDTSKAVGIIAPAKAQNSDEAKLSANSYLVGKLAQAIGVNLDEQERAKYAAEMLAQNPINAYPNRVPDSLVAKTCAEFGIDKQSSLFFSISADGRAATVLGNDMRMKGKAIQAAGENPHDAINGAAIQDTAKQAAIPDTTQAKSVQAPSQFAKDSAASVQAIAKDTVGAKNDTVKTVPVPSDGLPEGTKVLPVEPEQLAKPAEARKIEPAAIIIPKDIKPEFALIARLQDSVAEKLPLLQRFYFARELQRMLAKTEGRKVELEKDSALKVAGNEQVSIECIAAYADSLTYRAWIGKAAPKTFTVSK